MAERARGSGEEARVHHGDGRGYPLCYRGIARGVCARVIGVHCQARGEISQRGRTLLPLHRRCVSGHYIRIDTRTRRPNMRKHELKIEVAATPAELWKALSTAHGIQSWFAHIARDRK